MLPLGGDIRDAQRWLSVLQAAARAFRWDDSVGDYDSIVFELSTALVEGTPDVVLTHLTLISLTGNRKM